MKFQFPKVLVFIVLGVLILCLGSEYFVVRYYSAYRHISHGQFYLERFNFPKAIEEFRQAVSIRSDSGELRFFLGKALGFNGNLQEGIMQLQLASRNYNDFQLFHMLGLFLSRAGKVQEALDTVERGLCFARDNDELLSLKAQLLVTIAGQMLTPYTETTVQQACSEAERFSFGSAYLCKKQLEEAEQRLLDVPAAIDPMLNGEADCMRASIQFVKGNETEAISLAAQGLQLNPHNSLGLFWGARSLVTAGEFDAALRLYTHLVFSLDALQEQELRALVSELEQASLTASSSTTHAMSRLSAWCAYRVNQFEFVERYCESNSSSYEDIYLAGLLASRKGQISNAQSFFTRVLELNPDYFPAQSELWNLGEKEKYHRPTRILNTPVVVAP